MTRTFKRRTVSLSPEADAALPILMRLLEQEKVSRVIDQLIRAEMGRRGFTLRTTSDDMRLQIQVGGRRLPTVMHDGQLYCEVPEEGAYSLFLHNDSQRRRLAVVSVDGINVVNGEDAGTDGPGYVLQPGERLRIKGWLRDNQEAAAFHFGASKGSYAYLTERGARNVGVIGVAVFDAKRRIRKDPYISGILRSAVWEAQGGGPVHGALRAARGSLSATMPTKGLGSASGDTEPVSQSVGTGYGEAVDFETTTVRFQRADSPATVLSLRYGTAADLDSWGVPRPEARPNPSAFPADAGGCPPPPGWQG